MNKKYSILIPAYNECDAVGNVLQELLKLSTQGSFEIIVIDDCSNDGTAAEVQKYPVRLLSNIQNLGYGYSLKRGIRESAYDHIIILDADGSYPVSAIPKLIDEYEKGFDMVVGIREGKYYQGTYMKRIARLMFRTLSEFTTGSKIPDINSGMRIFRKDFALTFFHTLSSGFSFTTTITLAFMLNAHSVQYIPIEYFKRKGSSKVRYFRDTLRAVQIIVESITAYNPIKIYLLCAIGIIFVGFLSVVIAAFSATLAFLFFFTFAGAILTFSVGFITIFLRYMHRDVIGMKRS